VGNVRNLFYITLENQEQVQRFLTTDIGQQFNFIKDQILASESGFDGFYMALLEKRIVKIQLEVIIPIDKHKKLQFSI
jgi:hypothetical protein